MYFVALGDRGLKHDPGNLVWAPREASSRVDNYQETLGQTLQTLCPTGWRQSEVPVPRKDDPTISVPVVSSCRSEPSSHDKPGWMSDVGACCLSSAYLNPA